ncbi:hypothetical protein [Paraburkholderia youngii]|uniref:hypothetical protein n=1 Tax=Paraburkholderia youngii TaxID=2782701 RepID=UPI003D219619
MMKKLAVAMFFVVPAVAFSATYSVTEQSGVTTTGAKLTALGQTGCVYANVPIALGDILNYPDGTRQVCASGPNGPLMINVTSEKAAKH